MNTETNVFSTACFPPVSYVYYLINSKYTVIDVGEHYIKQTYRNRYKLAGANGIQTMVVPVVNTHKKTSVKDIKISYETNWQKIHLKTIETNYNKSPFYLYYKDYINTFFYKKYIYLFDLNKDILDKILNLININKNIEYSFEYSSNADSYNDYRNFFNPRKPDISEHLIFKNYEQVFSLKYGFSKNLSILDVIFNSGPDTSAYLATIFTGSNKFNKSL